MKVNYASLSALPISHPLRNRPLAEIGARYSNVHGNGRWTTVTPAFGIAKTTYNDLGQTWKENNLWQAPIEAA
jgi:hypothetical protein